MLILQIIETRFYFGFQKPWIYIQFIYIWISSINIYYYDKVNLETEQVLYDRTSEILADIYKYSPNVLILYDCIKNDQQFNLKLLETTTRLTIINTSLARFDVSNINYNALKFLSIDSLTISVRDLITRSTHGKINSVELKYCNLTNDRICKLREKSTRKKFSISLYNCITDRSFFKWFKALNRPSFLSTCCKKKNSDNIKMSNIRKNLFDLHEFGKYLQSNLRE